MSFPGKSETPHCITIVIPSIYISVMTCDRMTKAAVTLTLQQCEICDGYIVIEAFISDCMFSVKLFAYVSTQREVFEGETASEGGSGVLPRKFSRTCIANGAI